MPASRAPMAHRVCSVGSGDPDARSMAASVHSVTASRTTSGCTDRTSPGQVATHAGHGPARDRTAVAGEPWRLGHPDRRAACCSQAGGDVGGGGVGDDEHVEPVASRWLRHDGGALSEPGEVGLDVATADRHRRHDHQRRGADREEGALAPPRARTSAALGSASRTGGRRRPPAPP